MYELDSSVQAEFPCVGVTGFCTYPVRENGPAPSGGVVHCICEMET